MSSNQIGKGPSDRKILEVEIYKVLNNARRVKLKVLVDYMTKLGYKKVEVYNTVRWKLTNPLPHPMNKKIWADPMIEVKEELYDGRVTKVVILTNDWSDVDVEDCWNFFAGTGPSSGFRFW